MNIFSLVQTAMELGLICSLTVLALFLSYSMLNVLRPFHRRLLHSGCGCGCYGSHCRASLSGPPGAMAAGVLSGFITALLQTKMGIDSSWRASSSTPALLHQYRRHGRLPPC